MPTRTLSDVSIASTRDAAELTEELATVSCADPGRFIEPLGSPAHTVLTVRAREGDDAERIRIIALLAHATGEVGPGQHWTRNADEGDYRALGLALADEGRRVGLRAVHLATDVSGPLRERVRRVFTDLGYREDLENPAPWMGQLTVTMSLDARAGER